MVMDVKCDDFLICDLKFSIERFFGDWWLLYILVWKVEL